MAAGMVPSRSTHPAVCVACAGHDRLLLEKRGGERQVRTVDAVTVLKRMSDTGEKFSENHHWW